MPNFGPSQWGKEFRGHYPEEAFRSLPGMGQKTDDDIRRFVRLWMTEGIPFCFIGHPMVYENVRQYVADFLGIDPGNVSMVGSGRIGFSLSPRKFLRPFTPSASDLDLFVVSDRLFATLCAEYDVGFHIWKSGTAKPSAGQLRFLSDNEADVARGKLRGFIDSNKVPVLRPQYIPRLTLRCDVMLKRILKQLGTLDFVPAFRPKASLRVYRTWDAAIAQNVRSIELAISPRPAPVSASPSTPAAS